MWVTSMLISSLLVNFTCDMSKSKAVTGAAGGGRRDDGIEVTASKEVYGLFCVSLF